MRKSFTKFCWDFHFQPVQRNVNIVDLEKCWKMRIWTQKSASIQKRTSPLKFDNFAEKSEKDTVPERPYHSYLIRIRIQWKFRQNSGNLIRIHQKFWNLKTNQHFLWYLAKFREIFIKICAKVDEHYEKQWILKTIFEFFLKICKNFPTKFC